MVMLIRLKKKQPHQSPGGSSDGEVGAPPPPPAISQKPTKAKAPSQKAKALASLPEAALIKKPSASGSHSNKGGIAPPPASLEPSGSGAPPLKSDVSASALLAIPAIPPNTDQMWLTRKEVAAFLKSHGFPITVNRLAKYAVTGDGPDYRHWCGHVLYDRDTALAWARSLLVSPDPIKPKVDGPV
jgi:hypothetical protein